MGIPSEKVGAAVSEIEDNIIYIERHTGGEGWRWNIDGEDLCSLESYTLRLLALVTDIRRRSRS